MSIEMSHREFEIKAKGAEFYETPTWAVERILDQELMTLCVVDPCAGRGVLGAAARKKGHIVHEYDLNAWPDPLPDHRIQAPFDYLAPLGDVGRTVRGALGGGEFTVLMNPPFSLTIDFIDRSFRLGARKIVMFQRLAFLESAARRGFFERMMPARVWVCGDRATCWRGDIPEETVIENGEEIAGRKGRSASTPHAWFIWERGHRGAGTLQHLYKD
jgi:predicted RNA methylase